ncbi:hypothetical protein BC833DRAFT_143001 [Globomyces pollinis-pini]|nr:hypothetical protein BC833DRAFT_143001 [Globomyces pollinis-pini]
MSRVDLQHLRSEISLLEKNEFANLKTDIIRISDEASKLPMKILEETRRIQSNVRLELSMEKSRIREQQAGQEMRIMESVAKIDTEVAQFKTQTETIPWELFRTLFPLFCAGGALCFSYLRFIK